MKYAIVIWDGACDEPRPELGGKTPFEAADIPNADWIAANGRLGAADTVPPGFAPGSDVATLSLLGYDPHEVYTGRAPLEAAAQGIPLTERQCVLRANLVTLRGGVMADYSSGHITTPEARELILEVQRRLGDDTVTFHPGVQYRHLAVFNRDFAVKTTPPHDISDKPFAPHQPSGEGADLLQRLMDRSREFLPDHPVNKARVARGLPPATSLWFWGQGKRPSLKGFAERFGRRGAVITAVDLVRGVGALVGWDRIEVPGATGDLHTDYAAKGRYAVDALDRYDLVCTHIEAPDEAGHMGDAKAKVGAIEKIDRHVIGPVLERLKREKDWRILVMPDHPTLLRTKTHEAGPAPFAIAGAGRGAVDRPSGLPYGEANALSTGLRFAKGWELMPFFLS
jgi:2,3-bisphosphoglycerate-independent phosphoglycerate mutase